MNKSKSKSKSKTINFEYIQQVNINEGYKLIKLYIDEDKVSFKFDEFMPFVNESQFWNVCIYFDILKGNDENEYDTSNIQYQNITEWIIRAIYVGFIPKLNILIEITDKFIKVYKIGKTISIKVSKPINSVNFDTIDIYSTHLLFKRKENDSIKMIINI
jgi:hypothetical protein